MQEAVSLPTFIEYPADKQYLAEICVGWPSGLRIFLGAGCHLNNNKLLHQAIRSRCCESVQVLLDHKDTVLDEATVDHALAIANFEIVKSLMLSLAGRRRKLQELAKRHLPVHIQAQLALSEESLLDTNAIQVYSELKAFGIYLDPCLRVSAHFLSVYEWIDYDIDAAKMLFEAGFQNLEVEEERDKIRKGSTTLMRLAKRPGYRRHVQKVFETVLFLISKGADPYRRRCGYGPTAMHFLGRSVFFILQDYVTVKLGVWAGAYSPAWGMIIPSKKLKAITEILHQEWSPLDHRSWSLLETIFVDCHDDACSCACSTQGCLPRTCFFGELATWLGSSLCIQAMSEVIRFLGERWRAGSVKDLNDTLAPTVFRICMFDHLELTHTCCRRTDKFDGLKEEERAEFRDETERILDEQRLLIEQVEDQTAFFLSKYHEMDLGLPEFLLEYMSVEITKNPKAAARDEEKMREYEQEAEKVRRLGVLLDE